MKVTFFWNVAQCSFVEIDLCFRDASGRRPDDGYSNHLRSFGKFLQDPTPNIPEYKTAIKHKFQEKS